MDEKVTYYRQLSSYYLEICRPRHRTYSFIVHGDDLEQKITFKNFMVYDAVLEYLKLKSNLLSIIIGNQSARVAIRVVVRHCFTSLFGTNGILSDIVIR